ncbi:hypothetical protein FGU65_00470 [Methanoculleus sp. FWC-SCC1]|uniref:Uncharacterized protein n=1 Tax=Methanoculleus frigidifontis TaxID=2584085 RepID=A0ABT8M624_9EURY|nr:hypothetical protein [Methanoculleus sp. FWC-SCC1]MDN7023386.1 hypothetical protein [Methanoculleus sp. FWC-SCC1]
MQEKLRRPILFLVTVTAGSALIFIDIPPVYVIGGTVVVGVCVLIGTGALPLAEIRPSQIRASLKAWMDRRRRSPRKAARKPSRFSAKLPTLPDVRSMLAAFFASVRSTVAKGRAPEHVKKAEMSKIDAMLDQTLADSVPEEGGSGSRGSGGAAGDPLSALDDLDTESFDDLDVDGEVSRIASKFATEEVSALSEEEELAVADILKAHQDDLDDLDLPAGLDLGDEAAGGEGPGAAVRPTLQAPPAETLPEDIMGGLDAGADLLSDDLSALDDLDLDAIEIEGDGDEASGSSAPFAAPEDLEEAEEEEDEEEPEEELDMVTFASGGLADDDLMAELKADTKKRKVVEDVSLLRNLKGTKYSAQELADEMEELLRAMKPKQ